MAGAILQRNTDAFDAGFIDPRKPRDFFAAAVIAGDNGVPRGDIRPTAAAFAVSVKGEDPLRAGNIAAYRQRPRYRDLRELLGKRRGRRTGTLVVLRVGSAGDQSNQHKGDVDSFHIVMLLL